MMIRLFEDIKLGYYFSIILGVPAILTIFYILGWNLFLAFLVWLVWFVVCAIFFVSKTERRLLEIVSFREDYCNIHEYLARVEGLYQKNRRPAEEYYLRNLLTIGHLSAGAGKRAKALYPGYPPPAAKNARAAEGLVAYYNNLAAVYLQLMDTEKFNKALSDMRAAIDHPRIKGHVRLNWLYYYQTKIMMMQVALGNFENAENYFLFALERAEKLIEKVSYHYYLAKTYLHNGAVEQAEKCIRFIIDNGGDTFYVNWARGLKQS